MIPHARPSFGAAEERAVVRVLRSGQVACGAEVDRLEREFADAQGFRFAVAVASGTAALHLTLVALGARIGVGVLTSSYTCVAVLNAIRYCAADPVLADCAPNSVHMPKDVESRGAAIAVVPHLFGHLSDTRTLIESGVDVIEDCAMSLGATTEAGRPPGHGSRAAVFSFYATKPAAGGEGGMIATDDHGLADAVRDLRSYDQKSAQVLRYSYKLTDVQAAIVRCQLRRLPKFVARRRALAERYDEGLEGCPLQLPVRAPGDSCFRYVIRAERNADETRRQLLDLGVDARRPVHRPLHRELALPVERFPNAERLFLTALSLPNYPGMTGRDQSRVIRRVRKVVATSDP